MYEMGDLVIGNELNDYIITKEGTLWVVYGTFVSHYGGENMMLVGPDSPELFMFLTNFAKEPLLQDRTVLDQQGNNISNDFFEVWPDRFDLVERGYMLRKKGMNNEQLSEIFLRDQKEG